MVAYLLDQKPDDPVITRLLIYILASLYDSIFGGFEGIRIIRIDCGGAWRAWQSERGTSKIKGEIKQEIVVKEKWKP